MASSFPQELVLEVLGVSAGMMAIIPPILRGVEGCRGPYGVRRARRGEAHFSQPAGEVGAGGLRDWTPVSPDYPGLGRRQGPGHKPAPPPTAGAYGPGSNKPLGQHGVSRQRSLSACWTPGPCSASSGFAQHGAPGLPALISTSSDVSLFLAGRKVLLYVMD